VLAVPQRLSKPEFLTLSKTLCEDCRQWLHEVEAHHALTTDELAALNEAIEIIDRTTVKLVAEYP
jgi:hypothetical protein